MYHHGDVDHLDHLAGDRRPARRGDATRCSRWTATSRRSTTWPSVCARHGALLVLDEAHAVLGPELARDGPTVPVLRVGTLSKTLGSLGGFVAGPRPVGRPAGEPGPTASSSPRRSTPADAAARTGRARDRAQRRGRCARGPAAAPVDRVAPGPPVADRSHRAGRRGRAPWPRPPPCWRGAAGARHPPADGAGRTSRLRIALSAAHTDAMLEQSPAGCAPSSPPVGSPA